MYCDEELKRLIVQEHHSNAMTYFYDKNKDMIYRQACSILGSEQDAEDCTQEIFSYLLYGKDGNPGLDKFDPGKNSLKYFVTMVARNKIIDFWRRTKHKGTERIIDYMDPDDMENIIILNRPLNSPDNEVEEKEIKEQIREAIKRLKIKCQKVIRLYYICGLRQKEIAEALDTSIGTIGAQIVRCVKYLKGIVERDFPDLIPGGV